MSGNLNVLRRMLAIYGDGLMGGSEEEKQAGTVLRALHTAIALGATGELAALVRPWMDGKIVSELQAQPLDDQANEDAIAGLAQESAPGV